MESNRVYSVQVLPGDSSSRSPDSPAQIEKAFWEFLHGFRVGGEFVYRDRLRSLLLLGKHTLDVDLNDLLLFNEELGQLLMERPGECIPLLESALLRLSRQILHPLSRSANRTANTTIPRDGATNNGNTEENSANAYGGASNGNLGANGVAGDLGEMEIPDVQVTIRSGQNMLQFRELTANTLTKLVRLPGIVINASQLSSRATTLFLQCKGCRSTRMLNQPGGGVGTDRSLPRRCDALDQDGKNSCPLDPYVVVHDKCRFVDAQSIKLQEAPDMVPVGELPRHMVLHAERYLTGQVVPGSRVIVTGIYSTYAPAKNKTTSGAPALRQPYVRILGLELDTSLAAGGGGLKNFTPAEEEEFLRLSRSDDLYERFARSVAPSIFGSLDIKKAITCLLFGGSKKILPDGMRLRGDINVLLLGDPGTAKSQLLKFVEKVSPISVYTSGKGSSAAGLTASVQRDVNTREFYLEGGAMVLADGGVVCIDEFDKMRDEDRVAIHEAMEQQTISIAKAGITTILNSRTSVLAAANPVFGRYDDMKTPGENIDFQTTILSRFDMIFIVKDEHNEMRDRTIAKHVMNIHMNRQNEAEAVGEIDIDKMKRYVSFCKARCAPRLSPEASELLSSHFVGLRKQVQQVERDNDERSSIPITVRQLEAIIRISESLAKITLSPAVLPHHVEESIRLFKFSTMDAVSAGSVDGLSRGELNDEIDKIEKELRRRLPIGWTTSYQSLVREFVQQQGYTQHALERCLYVLEKRDVIRFSGQKKVVVRTGV
ncbi:MCM2/3/5 family-domain-containing protein [Filobasidium floriforme]|uniref:MCM2/3/5 family-domain-containing protein n=1 Tax=Filobasidium floriforme TaxID=5210 RepID=UPI001E8E47FC|nr:MCM2/3/5 family-domain-containing protein [Filobasidium floriforme]KAH8089163.1 MCM2/3/5 family-domain-containing protein [Filobasidium floriforme]